MVGRGDGFAHYSTTVHLLATLEPRHAAPLPGQMPDKLCRPPGSSRTSWLRVRSGPSTSRPFLDTTPGECRRGNEKRIHCPIDTARPGKDWCPSERLD